MKSAIVKMDISVEIVDIEVPKPGPDEVLVKVIIAGKSQALKEVWEGIPA